MIPIIILNLNPNDKSECQCHLIEISGFEFETPFCDGKNPSQSSTVPRHEGRGIKQSDANKAQEALEVGETDGVLSSNWDQREILNIYIYIYIQGNLLQGFCVMLLFFADHIHIYI